jgi:hypothetical protein
VSELDEVEISFGSSATISFRHAGHIEAELDIFDYSPPWKERIILKHHPAIRTRPFDKFSVEKYVPFGRTQKTRDQIEKRRFPASAGAQQAHELSVRNVEPNVTQRDILIVKTVRHTIHLDECAAAHSDLIALSESQLRRRGRRRVRTIQTIARNDFQL